MGAPFRELDDKAIRDSKHIPQTIRLYIGHHIRNDLAGLQFVSHKLKLEGMEKWADKIDKIIHSIALDLTNIGI